MSKALHLKGLNGIRAIAALSVMFSHINMNLYQFNLENARSIDLSGFGVTMFFALSGFLITYLLLLENENQDINIKKFYIRRALRIWPLYFLYLIISLLTIYHYNIEINSSSLPFYIFLAANVPFIIDRVIPFITGYWSIGVEEQFYLFWPWLIRFNKNKIFLTVLLFTIFFLVLRFFFWFIERKFGYYIPYLAIHVTRFDCMTIGALGALLYFEKNNLILKILFSKVSQIIAWSVIVLLGFNKFHIASIIDHEIVSIVTVILIFNVSANPSAIILLNNFLLNFIGKISYGIYIIHTLIIFYFAKILNQFELNGPIKYSFVYVGVALLTIGVSYLSYELFEKKFIILKDKFSIVKSQASLNG